MPDIILASGSASRRALLSGAGVQAESVKPLVDEETARASFRAHAMPVNEQAMNLAEMKSVIVSSARPGLVIGGDQMLNLEGTPFDKPEGMDGARAHLKAMSGKMHILETAVVVSENGAPIWRFLARPKLTMRELSDEFIENYLADAGEDILNTVGAYQLEGLGSQLFSKIEGDYFSILGLPLLPLLDYFRTRGVLKS